MDLSNNVSKKEIQRAERKISDLLDLLSLLSVLHYVVFRFLQSTMFEFVYTDLYKTVIILGLIITGCVRFAYRCIIKIKINGKKEALRITISLLKYSFLAIPFFVVGFLQNYKVLVFLPICALCLYEMQPERICRVFAFTIGVLLGATILCCLSGVVPNLMSPPWGENAASYGIVNSTDFASYVCFILLFSWCGSSRRDRETKAIMTLLSVLAICGTYFYTKSRTALITGALYIACSLWDDLIEQKSKNGSKALSFSQKVNSFLAWAFPLIGFLTILLVSLYGKQVSLIERLDQNVLSGRLKVTWLSYQKYGINALGSYIEAMHGNGSTLLPHDWTVSGYGYLDIAYAMLAIRYGWIITIIIGCLWVWMTVRAFKAGKKRIAFTLIILAIHGFSEARILDVNYNILLIMPFCAMSVDNVEGANITKTIDSERRLKWFSIILALVMITIVFLLLPRALSWLRTVFYIQKWNKGTAAIWALFSCVILLILLYVLYKKTTQGYQYRRMKDGLSISSILFAFILCVLLMNDSIRTGLDDQQVRLNEERDIILQIEQCAEMPVYAAEPSELYYRSIGGISDHVFSTDELGRQRNGSILTDRSVESLSIVWRGGKYAQLSEWTGIYSFDPVVIDYLTNLGFDWRPYFYGWRKCNLLDTARHNNLTLDVPIVVFGPFELTTKDMETDQFGGTYEVCVRLEKCEGITDNNPIRLIVTGEAGEKKIAEQEIQASLFNQRGDCEFLMTYFTTDTPKVTFSIAVPENTKITISEISWRRIE